LACSTGFSCRRIAGAAECAAIGIDRSGRAVLEAQRKAKALGSEHLSFIRGDAENLPFKARSFTHIVAGSCFGFFTRPALALMESHRVLRKQGKLCISTFAYTACPPDALLESIKRLTGVACHPYWTVNYWKDFFGSAFELVYSRKHDLPTLDHEAVARECVMSLPRGTRLSSEMRNRVLARLFTTRLITNEHRRYQLCEVSVWKKN
jgi:ubiquinone/menaquinone biosynthesis C-methylase UbiE